MQECKPFRAPIHVGVKLSRINVQRHKKRKTKCCVFHMLVHLKI
jgi:hypothetical protein